MRIRDDSVGSGYRMSLTPLGSMVRMREVRLPVKKVNGGAVREFIACMRCPESREEGCARAQRCSKCRSGHESPLPKDHFEAKTVQFGCNWAPPARLLPALGQNSPSVFGEIPELIPSGWVEYSAVYLSTRRSRSP